MTTQSELERVVRDLRDAVQRWRAEPPYLSNDGIIRDHTNRLAKCADAASAAIEAIHGATEVGDGRAATLFDAIAHGDEVHRAWLKEAIECHFAGKPVPPPRKADWDIGRDAEQAAREWGFEPAQTTPPPDNGDIREALEPFARIADCISPGVADNWILEGAWQGGVFQEIRAGDFRRARDVLSKSYPNGNIRNQALEEAGNLAWRMMRRGGYPPEDWEVRAAIFNLKSPKGD